MSTTVTPKTAESAIALIKQNNNSFDVMPMVTSEPGTVYEISRTDNITWLDILREYSSGTNADENSKFINDFLKLKQSGNSCANDIYDNLTNEIIKHKDRFFTLFYDEPMHTRNIDNDYMQDKITIAFLVNLALKDVNFAITIMKNIGDYPRFEPKDFLNIIHAHQDNKIFFEALEKLQTSKHNFANLALLARKIKNDKKHGGDEERKIANEQLKRLTNLFETNLSFSTMLTKNPWLTSPFRPDEIVNIFAKNVDNKNFMNELKKQSEKGKINLAILAKKDAKAAALIFKTPELFEMLDFQDSIDIYNIHKNDSKFTSHEIKYMSNARVHEIVNSLKLIDKASEEHHNMKELGKDPDTAIFALRFMGDKIKNKPLSYLVLANIHHPEFKKEYDKHQIENHNPFLDRIIEAAKNSPNVARELSRSKHFLYKVSSADWNTIINKNLKVEGFLDIVVRDNIYLRRVCSVEVDDLLEKETTKKSSVTQRTLPSDVEDVSKKEITQNTNIFQRYLPSFFFGKKTHSVDTKTTDPSSAHNRPKH